MDGGPRYTPRTFRAAVNRQQTRAANRLDGGDVDHKNESPVYRGT